MTDDIILTFQFATRVRAVGIECAHVGGAHRTMPARNTNNGVEKW